MNSAEPPIDPSGAPPPTAGPESPAGRHAADQTVVTTGLLPTVSDPNGPHRGSSPARHAQHVHPTPPSGPPPYGPPPPGTGGSAAPWPSGPQQYPPQQYPGQQYPPQQYPAQQYPPQQHPAQQFSPQQYPTNQHSGQQYPGGPSGHQPPQFPPPQQQYPAQQYPAQQYAAGPINRSWPTPGQPQYAYPPPPAPYPRPPNPAQAPVGAAGPAALPAGGPAPRPTTRRAGLGGGGGAGGAGAAGFAWFTVAAAPHPTAGAGSETGTPGTSGGSPTELAAVAAIPENGGVILADQKVVLTRESGDKVHCFSAVCTHQGCLVSQVAAGKISCPCHGSTFDANTGAVVDGPAPSPLAAVPVTVVNGTVYSG